MMTVWLILMTYLITAAADGDAGQYTTDQTAKDFQTDHITQNESVHLTTYGLTRELETDTSQSYEEEFYSDTDIYPATSDDESECHVRVLNRSIMYFHSQLLSHGPFFVQFKLNFNRTIKNRTDDVFRPLQWVWTFNTSSGPYPFLSWNIDYGILSFKLLDARTINIKNVFMTVEGNCNLTFGEPSTSKILVKALLDTVNVTAGGYYEYPESYFCYLSLHKHSMSVIRYRAAQYLNFPITYMNYECCSLHLNYSTNQFIVHCNKSHEDLARVRKWSITKTLPYLFGIIILLYFPVMFFDISAWLSKNETIIGNQEDYGLLDVTDDETVNNFKDDWLFADGSSPLTFTDLLSFKTIGLDKHKVLASRFRRLLVVLFFPVLIFIQITMYNEGMGVWKDEEKIMVKDLVKVGTPMGFLSILGDPADRANVFVPALGGPVGVFILYYVLGVLFIILPRSVKQVVEDGLPSTVSTKSSLFFDTRTVIRMSNLVVTPKDLAYGYTKASTLMRCKFYMLFTREFWAYTFEIQRSRFTLLGSFRNAGVNVILIVIAVPILLAVCVIEIVCCILFHGLPFFTFCVMMVNGAIKSLSHLRGQSKILNTIFSYRITAFLGVSTVSVLFLIYAYIISLVFLVSFGFMSQVITYCFVAVIIYPSVSFGYLFFFIVLVYYFIKLVRDFGNGYLELLTTAVDLSRHSEEKHADVSVCNGHVYISNIRAKNIQDIRINNTLLDVAPNLLRALTNQTHQSKKLRKRGQTYGIPKPLFDYLVRKHRPLHQQVLHVCMKSVMMFAFVSLTMSITNNYVSGPTTEISEVMHVIFIVAVGAVPQLVEAVLAKSNTVYMKEIEEREIEHSIKEYWRREEWTSYT